ncbi:MAG: DMT family transporter [Verrucomicrobiota bacterium]
MSWVFLSICSAFFLGLYDLAKKHSLRDNAVLPVLFLGTLTSALIWLPLVLWSYYAPMSYPSAQFLVDSIGPLEHIQLFAKSSLVGASWMFGYFAVKHLPLSIAAPIRATSPLWTILLAVLVMSERPNTWQWLGVIIVLLAFYAFSFVGKLEGIRFHRNKWVAYMIVATLLGACSAIYDKYLLQNACLKPATVQAWFSIYLALVILPFYIGWFKGVWPRGRFVWRWSIPLIGILLLIADYMYFTAITHEEALISVISPVRRTAVVVTFIGSITLYKEKNFRLKALCILILLVGITLIKMKTN